MSSSSKWIVCEQTGRWTAALRTAFARLPNHQSKPRLSEVRTLAELSTYMGEHGNRLVLIEVRRGNITDVIDFVGRRGSQLVHFVALVDGALCQRDQTTAKPRELTLQRVVDLLWETGAVEVVESPRHLHGLLALPSRLATTAISNVHGLAERQSFADWAWSTLPWQDT